MNLSKELQGLGALLMAKKPLILMTGLGVLGTTACLGVLMALGQASAGDVKMIASMIALLGIPAGPLIIAINLTLESDSSATARRLELLTLPVGRLAIPLAILLCSILTALVIALTSFAGLSIALSPQELLHELTRSGDREHWEIVLFCSLLFAYSFSIMTLGNHRANASALWIAVPALFCVSTVAAGFGPDDRDAAVMLWGWMIAGYYLGLPFLLYARPRHHWSPASLKGGRDNLDFIVLITGILSLSCVALFGFGKGLLFCLALGGLCAWRTTKKQVKRPRRSTGMVRLSNFLALGLLVPGLLFGLAFDASLVAEVSPEAGMKVSRIILSPAGRYALVVGISKRHRLADQQGVIRRAAVIDLSGKKAPLLFPARFAAVSEHCWSKDGRWVVVQDNSYGRLRISTGFRGGMKVTEPEAAFLGLCDGMVQSWVCDIEERSMKQTASLRVAPGWVKPEQLLHLSATMRGLLTYESLGGLSVQKTLSSVYGPRGGGRTPLVDHYDAKGAVLVSLKGMTRVTEAGFEPFKATRLPVWPWTFDVLNAETSKEVKAGIWLVLRKGKEERRLALAREWNQKQGHRLCYVTSRGLEILDLRTGVARVAIPQVGGEALQVFHSSFDFKTLIVRGPSEDGDGPVRDRGLGFLFSLRSFKSRPIVHEGGRHPRIWLGQRVLYSDDEGGWMQSEAGGPLRPLFP